MGLDYVKLGQPSPTLSGGEAQRIKLARELVKKSTGRTLYLLDEPTTGLHFADIQLLLKVLHGFVEAGNTVLVVEHNTEVIKTADWIIDLGPEGGAGGGRIIATGTPEEVGGQRGSFTGRVLKRWLARQHGRRRGTPKRGDMPLRPTRAQARRPAVAPRAELAKAIKVRGARQHNLKGIDVEIPRDQMTVCCGPSGSGKTLAGHGHDLCRRPAPLRGKPQLLRPAVRRQDAEAAAGPHRRPLAGHRHRAEARRPLAPQHGRHRHRDLRLFADPRRRGWASRYCPACDLPVGTQTADEIIDKIIAAAGRARGSISWPRWKSRSARSTKPCGKRCAPADTSACGSTARPTRSTSRRRSTGGGSTASRWSSTASPSGPTATPGQPAWPAAVGEIALAKGTRRAPRDRAPRRHARTQLAGRNPQPALRLPEVRAELRAAVAAQFFLQQSLGLVSGLRRPGPANGHEPGGPASRSQALAWPRAPWACGPARRTGSSRAMLESFAAGTGIPIDVPYDQLGGKHRRLIMHGTGEQWFEGNCSPLPPGEEQGVRATCSPRLLGEGQGVRATAPLAFRERGRG